MRGRTRSGCKWAGTGHSNACSVLCRTLCCCCCTGKAAGKFVQVCCSEQAESTAVKQKTVAKHAADQSKCLQCCRAARIANAAKRYRPEKRLLFCSRQTQCCLLSKKTPSDKASHCRGWLQASGQAAADDLGTGCCCLRGSPADSGCLEDSRAAVNMQLLFRLQQHVQTRPQNRPQSRPQTSSGAGFDQASRRVSSRPQNRSKACSYAQGSKPKRICCSEGLARLNRSSTAGRTPRLHSAILP